jgi:hypothetical protein
MDSWLDGEDRPYCRNFPFRVVIYFQIKPLLLPPNTHIFFRRNNARIVTTLGPTKFRTQPHCIIEIAVPSESARLVFTTLMTSLMVVSRGGISEFTATCKLAGIVC